MQFAIHRWYSHQLFCASSKRAVSFYVLSKVCCPLPTDTCRTWHASPASLQNDICARCQKKCQGEHQFASPKSNKNNLPKPPKHQQFLSREGTRKSSYFFLDQFKLKPMVTWGSPIWTFSLTTSATSRHLTSTGSKPGIWEKSATSTWRSAHWENRRYLWFIGPHKIAKLVYKWLISMVCGRYNELVNGDYHGYKHLLKIWIKHYN